jgi:hypothetical protein
LPVDFQDVHNVQVHFVSWTPEMKKITIISLKKQKTFDYKLKNQNAVCVLTKRIGRICARTGSRFGRAHRKSIYAVNFFVKSQQLKVNRA